MTDLSKAAMEVQAASEERHLGPKDHARCPDCMAFLRGQLDDAGRLELMLVRHADHKESPSK